MKISPAIPVPFFLASALVVLPLPWLLRTRNIPVAAYAFWLFQNNLFYGINAILWHGNVDEKLLIYCDIILFLRNASIWGQVAAALCAARNLERIASPAAKVVSQQNDSRNRTIFEVMMCCVAPIIYACCYFIVQGNRFNIYEDIGCLSATWVSWPAIPIFFLPPLYLAMTGSIYSMLAFKWLRLRRATFAQVLQRSNAGISTFQFYRLLALCIAQVILTLGGYTLQLVYFLEFGMQAWHSWDYTHYKFWITYQFPNELVSDTNRRQIWGEIAMFPAIAFLFFILFGLNTEMVNDLVNRWKKIRIAMYKLVGKTPAEKVKRSPWTAISSNTVGATSSYGGKSIPVSETATVNPTLTVTSPTSPTYPPSPNQLDSSTSTTKKTLRFAEDSKRASFVSFAFTDEEDEDYNTGVSPSPSQFPQPPDSIESHAGGVSSENLVGAKGKDNRI